MNTIKFSTFETVGRIVYGCGAAAMLGEEAMRLNSKAVAVITDKGVAGAGLHEPLLASLKAAGVAGHLYSEAEPEPSTASIERAAAWVRERNVELLVGLGGGSALDSTKATALLASHEGPVSRYFGMDKVPAPCMPTILIPTTAGTGSEMTSNAVLADPATQTKQGTVSPYLYARAVILDPELTVGLPPALTATTGVDALVHGIESFVSVRATPFTDAQNLKAIRMIAANIRRAYSCGGDLDARAQMLYGAALSGMGFSNTQNGVIHAIGMSVDPVHHIPHGLMIAICTPMGLAYNAITAPEKLALVAEILNGAPLRGSLMERAKAASGIFSTLLDDLGIERGLGRYGIGRDELPGIAERAAAYRRLMDSNPRQGTKDSLLKLLEAFY